MINCEFPPIGGGAANMNHYFLKEAAQRDDISIDFVTSSHEKSGSEILFGENIRVWYVKIEKEQLHYWTHGELFSFLRRGYTISKELTSKNKYDIVHAVFGYPSGIIAYALRKEAPYLISLRGSDVPGFNKRFSLIYKLLTPIIRKIWGSASAVTSNSEGLKELASLTSGNIEIKVIPNGVDTKEFNPSAGDRRPGKKILTVARLIERKGIHYLIEAFPNIIEKIPEATLTIIGSGRMSDKLKKLVSDKNLTGRVSFLGEVLHESLPPIMTGHDIFVLPSFNEGMSNAMMEAMASGLPIVTTATGGTLELLGEGGTYIEKGSPESIVKAVTGLFGNEAKMVNMSAISRHRAETYSWSSVVESYMKIYGEIVKGN